MAAWSRERHNWCFFASLATTWCCHHQRQPTETFGVHKLAIIVIIIVIVIVVIIGIIIVIIIAIIIFIKNITESILCLVISAMWQQQDERKVLEIFFLLETNGL